MQFSPLSGLERGGWELLAVLGCEVGRDRPPNRIPYRRRGSDSYRENNRGGEAEIVQHWTGPGGHLAPDCDRLLLDDTLITKHSGVIICCGLIVIWFWLQISCSPILKSCAVVWRLIAIQLWSQISGFPIPIRSAHKINLFIATDHVVFWCICLIILDDKCRANAHVHAWNAINMTTDQVTFLKTIDVANDG